MPEHLIRLRGGWERQDLDAPESGPTRITLPIHLDSSLARRVRLSRRFGSPPLQREVETLGLRLHHVPGLVSVTINGSPFPLPPQGGGWPEIALHELPQRNLLVLEVNLAAVHSPGQAGASRWGEIALVVRAVAR